MKLNKILLVFSFIAALAACKKEDKLTPYDPIGLGGDSWVETELDKWIWDSITKPYNIMVKYKWDKNELDLNRTLTPIDEDLVIPMWSTFKDVFIKPYVETAGSVFFKKYVPKTFVIIGSNSYNDNGSITLGTAGSATKIVLYSGNSFRNKKMPGYVASRDSLVFKQFFIQTIYHEFAHILHQTTMYTQDFKRINPSYYMSSNWINVPDTDARKDGFITSYGASAFDEDFVEMVANMLVNGRVGFDYMVNSIPAGTSANGVTRAQAISYIRQKENIVVAYFKQVWNIDFYLLQSRTRAAIEQYI